MRNAWMAVVAILCLINTAFAQGAEWTQVEQVLGKHGTTQDDMLKVTFPRTDLKVRVDDVLVKPDIALTSWVAFKTQGNAAMAMGDLVLLPQEVEAVETRLLQNGFEVSGIHNHLIGETPQVMYMHFDGHGEPVKLAQGLKDVLQHTKTPLSSPATSKQPVSKMDWTPVESAMGMQGKVKGDVVQFSIPRAETITDSGMVIPPFMGTATAINFQKAGSSVATTGDFVLTENEINPVVRTLTESGITVTAVHNHMIHESPRIFFMHFWGHGDPVRLAKGLRLALDKTNFQRK